MNQVKTVTENLQNLGLIVCRVDTLICSVSNEGYFTELNDNWQKTLGWTIAEMLTMPVISLIHPDDRQKTKEAADKMASGKEITEFRNRYRHKSGEYIWFQWSATWCSDLPGAVYMATALVINNTVKMEQSLTTSRDLLKQAERIAKIGHWNLDIKTNKLFWSDALYDIHGVTRETFTPELATALNFYHPEDIPIVTGIVEKALREYKGWTFNLRIVRTDGNIIVVRCIGDVSFDNNGEAKTLFGVLQDISDYEFLNARFELLSKVADTSTTGMVICDEFKHVLWVNNAFENLTKYSFNELVGKAVGPFLQGADTDPSTIEDISSKLSQGKDIDVEILNYDKQGDSYWNHLLISAVKKDNKITHYIGLQQDITHKKRQQEIISRNQKMEVVGQLAAGICHDFNNIMAIISGNIQLLNMSNTDPKLTQYIDNLETATERATNLTKRLDYVSRSEPTKVENIFISLEIEKACEMLSASLPKSVQIITQLQMTDEIKCQKDNLLDSIVSLIINAKSALQESGEIIVKTELVNKWGERTSHVILRPIKSDKYCVITVSDNGIGIAEENIKNIFEPYYTTRSNNHNLGLGLSQLFDYASIENIGITIASQKEQGTSISLWLPKGVS